MQKLIKIVVATMALTAFSPLIGGAEDLQPGGQFYDDDGGVHEPSIEALAAAAVARGCNPPTNTLYCPAEPVTRGEMAALLSRALDLAPAETSSFEDTRSSIFSADIDRLAQADITRGCNPPENSRFCPDEPVTRGQMAAFLARAFTGEESRTKTFVDDDGSIFEAAIERIAAAGITVGCNPPDNDRFCPEALLTRGEVATFLTRALSLTTTEVTPRPHLVSMVSRTSWGAAAAQGPYEGHDIDQITIHHSDDSGPTSGPARYRSWQAWHQHLGWSDIAYHLIVGVDGTVYEGRPMWAVGATATEYDPTGHLLIVVEGDFDDSEPTTEQLESLAQLVAWASMYFDVPTVTGHRDHASTTCPGDFLYAELDSGAIAARAAELVRTGGVTLLGGDQRTP